MAIIERIPVNPNGVRVRYPVKRFSAPFAAGQYDFNQAGNQDIPILPLANNSIYLIERINFFAGIAEATWLESMDTEANFPFFKLHLLKSPATSIFPEPIRCVNYIDNAEQLVFFRSLQKDDTLLITFGGIINQVAASVGIDPMLAEVNFTLYQVINEEWAKKFIDPKYYDTLGLQ